MDVTEAKRVLEQDYFEDVRNVANEFKQMWEDGEFSDREEAIEWLDQTTDGHSRVIYNFDAGICLAFTDNADAYDDQIGGEATVNARACLAFRQDIIDRLDRDGIDINDDPPSSEDKEREQETDAMVDAIESGATIPGDAFISSDPEEGTVTVDAGREETAICVELTRLSADDWKIETDFESEDLSLDKWDSFDQAGAVEKVAEIFRLYEAKLDGEG